MPLVTLFDGKTLGFDQPLTALAVAQSIAPSLAKRSIAARINGQLMDLSTIIDKDCQLLLITADTPEGLEVIRHSTAHLLAQAVKQVFPEAQVAMGPVIEDGFYYDFANVRPFTPDDLEALESTMKKLAQTNSPITRRILDRDAARAYFQGQGEAFKAKIIEDIPADAQISLYRQAEFEDLCRGPHVPSTGHLKVFKLLRVAGAYWKGDQRNPMLQRIYGTAWASQEQLDQYIHRLEEAEKRDHRKIGRALGWFHFQDITPGMVFWHPKGWTVYQLLEQYIRERLQEHHYQEVKTPQLVDKILWEKSGHWENFRDNMFVTETENRQYAVKPMNCPCHVQIYNAELRSYRELPLRLSEFGNCHRCEPSGSLHGLLRVRNFVQDDAHIFCTEPQIQDEVSQLLRLIQSTYRDFGFNEIKYRLALRPEKRVGAEELWDQAEQALQQAMMGQKIEWEDAPGEGAFYGPKIECSLSDSLGRVWQCGTIQIDFSMPRRLDAQYVAEDGSKQYPVMIHRAVLGTFERFMGILIEHYAGKMPFWLSPIQAVILTISDKQLDFGAKVAKILKKNEIRVELDLRNEKIGFKIREHTLQRVPYLLVIGDKEVESESVSVRDRDGKDYGVFPLQQLADALMRANTTRRLLLDLLED